MRFNSKVYDLLKWVALIVLPAFAVMYIGLGELWDWQKTKEVVGTITLVDTFLGALLQLSNASFKNSPEAVDGYIGSDTNDPDTGIPDLKMTITRHPKELLSKGTVTLKVGNPPILPVERQPLPDDLT